VLVMESIVPVVVLVIAGEAAPLNYV
jgi:hypothetical protein